MFLAGWHANSLKVNGGRTRTRTVDPLIKSQLLYQLSYAPKPLETFEFP